MSLLTKLNPEKFSPLLGSWWRHTKPFFMSGGLDEVFSYLKGNKEEIFPKSQDLWKPFQLCDYKDLKLVIVVEGPYLDQRGNGLALSWDNYCSGEQYLPEPLEELYKALERELYGGLCLSCIQWRDLAYLAKQGVLLLNFPLTGDKKNGPHKELWKPFIHHILQEAIAYTGVPVILIGKEIWELEEFLVPWQERFMLEYPGANWDNKGAFKRVDEILKENNNISLEWTEKLPF